MGENARFKIGHACIAASVSKWLLDLLKAKVESLSAGFEIARVKKRFFNFLYGEMHEMDVCRITL